MAKKSATFPATPWQSARPDDAFSEAFERETRPVEVQSLQKRRQRKGKKKKTVKKETNSLGHFPFQNFDFRIVRMPKQICRKTERKWKERHVVMLQMPF